MNENPKINVKKKTGRDGRQVVVTEMPLDLKEREYFFILLRTQGLTISRALNNGEDESTEPRKITEISCLFIRTYTMGDLANVEPLYVRLDSFVFSEVTFITYKDLRHIIEEDLKLEKYEENTKSGHSIQDSNV